MAVVAGINDFNDALDSSDNIIIVNRWDGGFIDAMDADIIQEGELSKANDCVFDNHILNLVKGSRYYGNEMISGTVISIYYYKKY